MSLDPRQDLTQDNMLWELILTCATKYKDTQIFGNLHGLRCAGSTLSLKDDTLALRFPSDFDETRKKEIRSKYIVPYTQQIKELFQFSARWYKEYLERKDDDFFERDILTKGYKYPKGEND